MSDQLAISAGEFAAAMAQFSPFEVSPVIAIGVSGGPDSLALLHLLCEWAHPLGGHVVAMTVDHGIRADSADEVIMVAQWASRLGADHVAVRWDDPRPDAGGLQERAREARYNLLGHACAMRGILHLAAAHHADDQAETLLLRFAAGSGTDGLAGMSPLTHLPNVRLLRPVLSFPGNRLRATCQARNQPWIEDPTNQSPRFARSRIRQAGIVLEREGLTAQSLNRSARSSLRTRAALDRASSTVLARSTSIFPQGYAEVTLAPWLAEDPEFRNRAIGDLVRCIGGEFYPPPRDGIDDLVAMMLGPKFKSASLGGCVVEASGQIVRVMREQRNIPDPIHLTAGQWAEWDRFRCYATVDTLVGALGDAMPDNLVVKLPKLALKTQPAFWMDGRLLAIPSASWYAPEAASVGFAVSFSPANAIGASDFAIV